MELPDDVKAEVKKRFESLDNPVTLVYCPRPWTWESNIPREKLWFSKI